MDANSWSLYVRLRVRGRPASFATRHEAAWRDAVRSAVHESEVTPAEHCQFRVVMRFFTAGPRRPDERWDLDNLTKPTLDAMDGVFGLRPWRGIPQPEDDRVDELGAGKEQAADSTEEGAAIEVWIRPE